ncbi:PD-(D/E)XK nuclease family protein [Bacillus sp. CRN 9]|nr:PD-(D/E)XK nuclease family protein [Bacillus sp. CRN 9]
MIFSFSRLQLYNTCQKRFYFKYILNLKDITTKPLALGKAVHKGIEAIIKGSTFENAILEGYTECDFHKDVSINEISKLVENAPVYKNQGETEVYFCFPLSDSPSSPKLQGYIDLVTDREFKDWKSNWRTYSVMDNHQLSLYAWAISKMKNKEIVLGSLYFLRYRKEFKHFFTIKEMNEARKWALGIANEINSKRNVLDILPDKGNDLFPSSPSSACSHCPFAIECYYSKKTKIGA